MYIKSLELKNFGCFKNLKIDSLEKNKIYIVYGENKDDDAKNGLGKSHFLESIPVCLYGETLRPQLSDIKKYVSWFASKTDNSEIDIVLHDGLQITRTLSPKEEVKILNVDDNDDIKNKRTKTYQNEFIGKLIGTFNNFKFLHYFNPSSLVFFTLKPKEKYLFVEELLGIEKLSEMLDTYNAFEKSILEDLNKSNGEISKLELEKTNFINSVSNEILRLENNIEKIILEISHSKKSKEYYDISFKNSKTDFVIKIGDYSNSLQNLNNLLRQKFKNIKSHNDDVNNLKTELQILKNSINVELPIKTEDLRNIKTRINNLNKVLGVVEEYLKNPSKCPTCKRDYILNIDEYVKEYTEIPTFEQLKTAYDTSNLSIDQHTEFVGICSKISLIENQIKSIESDIFGFVDNFLSIVNQFVQYMNNDINNELYQLLIVTKDINYLESSIKLYIDIIKDELTSFIKLLKMLNKDDDYNFISDILNDGFLDINYDSGIDISLIEEAYNNFINKYYNTDDNINEDDLKLKIVNNNDKIDKLKNYEDSDKYKDFVIKINKIIEDKLIFEKKLEKAKILTKELGWSGEFRKVIVENYLKDLEEKYNEHISKLFSSCKVQFKLDLKGKEKGIHIILFDGDIIKSYGELSSAEKRMVDICLLLTFAEYSDGLIVIDEALDSLSYENQVRVINLLHETGRQIFLVSHNMELIKNLKYQHTNVEHINFIKENGISILN